MDYPINASPYRIYKPENGFSSKETQMSTGLQAIIENSKPAHGITSPPISPAQPLLNEGPRNGPDLYQSREGSPSSSQPHPPFHRVSGHPSGFHTPPGRESPVAGNPTGMQVYQSTQADTQAGPKSMRSGYDSQSGNLLIDGTSTQPPPISHRAFASSKQIGSEHPDHNHAKLAAKNWDEFASKNWSDALGTLQTTALTYLIQKGIDPEDEQAANQALEHILKKTSLYHLLTATQATVNARAASK